MPVLEIHLIAGRHDDAAISTLLREASELFVDILYGDMEQRPIGRARAFATMHAEAHWAAGGQPAVNGGIDAPYFTCLTLAGRPSDQHEHLLKGVTALIVKHLKVDRSVVRGRIIPVDPAHWSIGGSVASTARKAEIDGRRSV
jgi:4-oxalocrotonate tautomerase